MAHFHDVDLTQWLTLVGIAVGAAATGFAGLSWLTSARGRKDQAVAEVRRRHRELHPEFDVTAERKFSDDVGLLTVKLIGPRDLDRLDWIQVTIRDDKPRRGSQTQAGRTDEEVARQIWGPFRLRPGVDGADREGRTARQGGPAMTDSCLFTVEHTTPPQWYSGGTVRWRKDYRNHKIRLSIESGRGEHTWSDSLEVPIPLVH